MIFKQYYLGCLAHASYLIGDEETKTGIVVDPQRDVDQYLNDAKSYGLEIKHVFLTHFHADFVAGHLELRDRVQAKIHLGSQAKAEFSFIPNKTGDQLQLNDIRLEILETPGHTPESISILVFDLIESPFKPKMVLTGDTLFIGDVGRPDLMASVGFSALELAEMLYASLREKLMPLPDDTLVYPAHGAGSLCGKNLSDNTVSTIGEQKRSNYALQPMTNEEFIALVIKNQPQAPNYFSFDAQLNKKERPNLDVSLQSGLKPLSVEEVLTFQNQGYQILDTRPEQDFNAAHLRGAIGISLSGNFATWCGTLLKNDIPIIIISEPEFEFESELRLGRIGFDNVAGYLQSGMKSLKDNLNLISSTHCWTPKNFKEKVESREPLFILDVRSPNEYSINRLKNATNIPLNNLTERFEEVPRDKTVLIYCEGGYRSSIACSIFENKRYPNVRNLLGGFAGIKNSYAKFTESPLPV